MALSPSFPRIASPLPAARLPVHQPTQEASPPPAPCPLPPNAQQVILTEVTRLLRARQQAGRTPSFRASWEERPSLPGLWRWWGGQGAPSLSDGALLDQITHELVLLLGTLELRPSAIKASVWHGLLKGHFVWLAYLYAECTRRAGPDYALGVLLRGLRAVVGLSCS